MVSNGLDMVVSATARLKAILEKPREAERRGMSARGGLMFSESEAAKSEEMAARRAGGWALGPEWENVEEEWMEDVSVMSERVSNSGVVVVMT